ncbi:MAG TPA: anti-sigma factor [Candidatus Dormibacteraeota bacterium]|nr:anti-sigma factor [Candidatus Dormibacteraeota bacterium]
MTCDDADLLLAAYAVGALDADDRLPLRSHLVDCDRCRHEGTRYVQAAEFLALGVDLVTPPPALRSRIMARVHAEAAGEPVPGEPWYRRLWSVVPSGRGLTVAGAGAALAAVAAAALVAVLLRRGPGDATLIARSCGLTAAPGACATLTYVPDARQAVLSVDGLTPIETVNGRPTAMYEVWLIRPDGSPTAAAFLTPTPDGKHWTAAMNADVSQYAAVATTREAPGNTDYPRGTEVLRISVPTP